MTARPGDPRPSRPPRAGSAPGARVLPGLRIWQDHDSSDAADRSSEEGRSLLVDSHRVVRNVRVATLDAYLPTTEPTDGAGVIVVPGGAYRFLMMDHEGWDVASRLVEWGVAAFVLKYRLVPTPPDDAEFRSFMATLTAALLTKDAGASQAALLDAESDPARDLAEEDCRQAIRFVRRHAAGWSLDPAKIGIVGFSAGGGVAVSVAKGFDDDSRPDFAAALYPTVRPGIPVPADAPPLFVAIADDDPLIEPSSAVGLWDSWHRAGRPAELHVFGGGGHGFGMTRLEQPSDAWDACWRRWLVSIGQLGPRR